QLEDHLAFRRQWVNGLTKQPHHIGRYKQLLGVEMHADEFRMLKTIQRFGRLAFLLVEIIKRNMTGSDVKIKSEVLDLFEFPSFFPYFNKDIGHDFLRRFFELD